MVDLASHGGKGFCSCPDFRIRVEAKLNRKPHRPCRHITACREMLDQFLKSLGLRIVTVKDVIAEFVKRYPCDD